MDVDVAVVGLGAMGSAALWRLARRGARVAGFDRFSPPHDRGSTHGESRIIRSAYFEDPAYLPLVREAFALWHELEAESGESLLLMTGAAMIGAPSAEVVAGALETARVHGLDHELLDAPAAAARLPQHVLDGADVVLLEGAAGVLRPERCVAAALSRAVAHGAAVHRGVRVSRVEAHADSVTLHTDAGAVTAGRAVVCAGPWTASLLPELPVPLSVERQVMAWLPVRDPQAFAPARFPVFIRQLDSGRAVYGLPSLDGATVKLAVHHDGEAADPDTVRREVDAADVAPLLDFAAQRLRAVELRVARAAVCLYTNTPDEHFAVGAVPGCAPVVVVSACSGHGFKFAPVIGDIAADLALAGTTPRPIARFDPTRFAA